MLNLRNVKCQEGADIWSHSVGERPKILVYMTYDYSCLPFQVSAQLIDNQLGERDCGGILHSLLFLKDYE